MEKRGKVVSGNTSSVFFRNMTRYKLGKRKETVGEKAGVHVQEKQTPKKHMSFEKISKICYLWNLPQKPSRSSKSKAVRISSFFFFRNTKFWTGKNREREKLVLVKKKQKLEKTRTTKNPISVSKICIIQKWPQKPPRGFQSRRFKFLQTHEIWKDKLGKRRKSLFTKICAYKSWNTRPLKNSY